MSVLTLAHQAAAATPCRSQDPEMWFSEDSGQIESAQAHCRICPVRTACLAGALERAEPWGVWGGELFERGVIVARKRPKGRPRKDDAVTAELAANALAERLAEVEAELAADLGLDVSVSLPSPRTAPDPTVPVASPSTGGMRTSDEAAA